MIDIDTLNKFLDESNELIKKSRGLDDIAKCKPLCSFRIDSDGDSIVFAIEARGFIKDEIVFFLVAKHGTDDSSKFISRGHFTATDGHCTSFAMSHDEPRGMTIQQGVLIEMRNLVDRMGDGNKSKFIDGVKRELNGVKVRISVVKSDEDPLEKINESCESSGSADDTAFGQLNLKGDKPSNEKIMERVQSICHPDPVEDIVDSEFAKSIGNRDEKPEDGNGIDDALKGTKVYQIEKQTLWQRIMHFLRKLLGLEREKEELDGLCSEMFGNKEDK
jgi:hypothetical protein